MRRPGRPARVLSRSLLSRSLLRALSVFSLILPALAGAQLLDFSPSERAAIHAHGPWPPTAPADPSNRWATDPRAAALGRALFFDGRLSRNGKLSCASCHRPQRSFQDGRRTGIGLESGVRNTPGLFDVAAHRWFGWDGASDSLWAASLRPILAPHEMGGSAAAAAALVRDDPNLRRRFIELHGSIGADDEATLVLLAKALAAYQATLRSAPTSFDHFRDALARGDLAAAATYPLGAQRGLRLFIGAGRCSVCHAGPHFTNGEFADVGLPFFVPGGVDPGRHGGIGALRESRFNRLGAFADDGGTSAVATRHVLLEPRHFGEFRVPGLRQLAHTAPYMHDGSLATLAQVIRHYSELDESRLHAEGERILRALRLSPQQAQDLESFLRSLSR